MRRLPLRKDSTGQDLRMTSDAPAPPSPSGNLPSVVSDDLPEIIHRAGANAVFAAREFFEGTLRNPHTQRTYRHAVKLFLKWIGKHGGGELTQIAPWHVGQRPPSVLKEKRDAE